MCEYNDKSDVDEPSLTAAALQLIPVVFADTQEEASRYTELLQSRDIPAVIGEDPSRTGWASPMAGMPILVGEGLHDQACEILASMEAETSAGLDDDDDDEALDDDDDFEDDDFPLDDEDGEDFDDDDDDDFDDDLDEV